MSYATEVQLRAVADSLASGEFAQGNSRLRTEDIKGNFYYCCLGVANEVCKVGVFWYYQNTPASYLIEGGNYIFLPLKVQHALASLNDNKLDFQFMARIFYAMALKRNEGASWETISEELRIIKSYLS